MMNCILNIDRNPVIIKYAQTAAGKILIIVFYAVFMHNIPLFSSDWQRILILTITAITFLPKYRHLLIFTGMMCLLGQGKLITTQPDGN